MPELFNVHGFGPSVPFTGHATCSCVDHGVSGRNPATQVEAFASTNAILRLAFATAPGRKPLALPQTCTRRSIMQKVRRHTLPIKAIVLRPLVSVWFQVLFIQLVAVLFNFQSPYYCAIGHRVVFSLARWSGRFHTGFHEPRATLVRLSTPITNVAYGAITRCGRSFQIIRLFAFQLEAPSTPGRTLVWAVPLSLAATYGIHVCLFSCGYLDVSVPRVRSSTAIHSPPGDGRLFRRVSAFRNPRINACLPASRGISQATTSFIASRCQVIHHTPLVA